MGEIAGLYWEEHGPADGPPVILSPGLGGSGDYWKPNLAALASAGFRTILYDHRGTGRSDRTLQPGLTVADMADDVLALADGLGVGRFSLVGHAAGGLIGLQLALDHPGRLAMAVIVNGFAKADPHFLRCMEVRLALLRACGVEAFVLAQPLFLYPSRWISDNWQRLAQEAAHQIVEFQGVTNIEARIAALAAFDVEDRLAGIATELVLIYAEDDMLVPPPCSERIDAARQAMTYRFSQGGHACNITQADEFNEQLCAFAGALA